MRKVWFWAIALISLLCVLSESFLRKAIAVSLCTVLGFNSATCSLNLAKVSERAVAASPPAPYSNLIVAQNSDDNPPVFSFYINGIRTSQPGYGATKPLVENLLNAAGVTPPKIDTDTYNDSAFSDEDLSTLSGIVSNILVFSEDVLYESRRQILHRSSTADALVNQIVSLIKDRDKQEADKAKQDCKKHPKAKFIIVAHSQGNFFANEVGSRLDRDIAKRTIIFGISPFTAYLESLSNGVKVNLTARPGDISTYGWLGIPAFVTPELGKLPKKQNGKDSTPLDAHALDNYLGNPTDPAYAEEAGRSLMIASRRLRDLVSSVDPDSYEKKKDCDEKPQPQDEGGTTWGDPHLVTFDRLKYDHHAVGEFILAKSTDSTFEIQVREGAVPASSQVALNTAAAMKVGNTRVAFYVKDFPDSDTTNPLRVDGKPTVIQGDSLSLPGGGSISQVNQGSYIVEWTTGERVGVKVDNFGSSALLDINPALPQTRQGQLIGLLGNFNGNPDDDLKSRDGKVLPPQSTINQVSQITQNLTNWVPIPLNQVESLFLEQLHKQFGDSWRISQQESLFDYAPGKNTESFTNRAFPNGFQVLRMLLPAQVQAAEAACQKAGVPAERLEGCLFDVGVTGNADFAQAAANALTNIIKDRVEQQIRDRIPVPGGIRIPGIRF